jgi:hypothetical protein
MEFQDRETAERFVRERAVCGVPRTLGDAGCHGVANAAGERALGDLRRSRPRALIRSRVAEPLRALR